MTYRIKVKSITEGDFEFSYNAITHPNKGDILYYRDTKVYVVEVGHVVRTEIGKNFEYNTLSFVELLVNYA